MNAHLRPYLALEPAKNPPILIEGVLQTWRHLDEGGPWAWYERSLPASFRRDFRLIPGLEDYAGDSADSVPVKRRSRAWTRLLGWKRRYKTLDLRQKVVLLKLLGMLGYYRDNAGLMERDAPPPKGAPAELRSEYAYLKANNRVLLDEPALKGDYSEMFRVAERAPAGTPIRLLAAIKSMTLHAEHGQDHQDLHQADRIARETLAKLRDGASPSAFAAMSSRYWRTASYLPFLRGNFGEVTRRQGRAEDLARRAIAEGTRAEAHFARDILYAVLATRATTDMRIGRAKSALPRLKEMAVMDPMGAWQRLWLGMAFFELGKFEEARVNFLAADRLAPPGKLKAREWLARCA